MTIVKCGSSLYRRPDFIHDFGYNSDNPLCHEGINYKTLEGFQRHRAVEKILYKAREWLTDYDAIPGYRFLELPLDILFGLNCKFPLKHIALFVVWSLRKGCYDYIGEVEAK